MTNYGVVAVAMPGCVTASAGYDELICGSRHRTIDKLSSSLFTGKGSVVISLVCAGGMSQVHTYRQEKQSPLILHPDVGASCHKLSWALKPGSSIFNPNPSSIFWNGTMQHSQGEGIQENDGSRNEKSVTV